MADSTLLEAGAPANAVTSRRALLGALAIAAPVTGTSATLTCPAIERPGAFAAAVARYRIARAKEEAFDNRFLSPAAEAAQQADRAVPHHSFPLYGKTVSTRDWREVRSARSSLNSVRVIDDCAWQDHREMHALVTAADRRNATVNALPETKRWSAMSDRSDQLCDVRVATRDAALAAPVSNLTELAEKFDLIEHYGFFDRESVVEQFRADMARLMKGEQA